MAILINLLCLIFVIFIIFCVLLFRQYKYNKKYLVNVKGPKTFLLFGNTKDFVNKSTDQYLKQFIKYYEDYGDIVKAQSGFFQQEVLVCNPKLAEYILSSVKHLDKAPFYKYFTNWLETGLLTSTGSKWRIRRRIITPSYHFSILEDFIDIFDSVGNKLIKYFEQIENKEKIDIQPIISLCTLDIICEASMGVKINALKDSENAYIKSVKFLCNTVTLRTISMFHDNLYPLRPLYYKEKRALKIVHSFTENVIRNRMAEKAKLEEYKGINSQLENDVGMKKKRAFLDLLLDCKVDNVPLSLEDLREEVNTFMFEGHDTTSAAITFALYSLSRHPEVQNKVFEEQKYIFGENYKSAPVTNKAITEMKYLELVIKETLRLYPPVPAIGRTFVEDFEFDGSLYPKGGAAVIIFFIMHRDPRYYDEPDKFIPERFENATITSSSAFQYLPFSAGPRNCIGQKFAMMEMKSTLSKIVRNFVLSPPDEEDRKSVV